MAALEASVEQARSERSLTSDRPEGLGDELDGLTRDELYERARDTDIDGRSKMTKDELIAAIEQAS